VHAPELAVRRAALEPQLQEVSNGPTIWVEGFQENDFLQNPDLAGCFFSSDVASAMSKNDTGLLLRRMASTTLKHWFTYWHMTTEGFTEALVLEDDARPLRGWSRTLAQLQQQELKSLESTSASSGSREGAFMPSPMTSLVEAPAAGVQETPVYDFLSLGSCASASSLAGLHSSPRSEKRYSQHLFLPKENFTHRCYGAYLISAPGASKLLLSRLAPGSPGLQQAKRRRAQVDFSDVSPADLMGESAWALGKSFRIFWCEPLLFEHSQLGGSSHFAAGSLQEAFRAPAPPDPVEVVKSLKKLEPKASDFVISLGAGNGKDLGADGHKDPIYPLFKDLELGGLAAEPDPHYAGQLSDNLPWDRVRKVVGLPITPFNVARLLESAGAPQEPLYLKIGLDSYDCDVIYAILAAGFQPRAWHVKINPEVPPPYIFGVHYDPNFKSLGGTGGFYGCSLSLVDAILRPHQYTPVQAGGHYEVVYVRETTWSEVPVTYAWESIKGSHSSLDETDAGVAWHEISWNSPDSIDSARAVLASACAATQAAFPTDQIDKGDVDDKTAEPFGLAPGCPVHFTFSTDWKDFELQALGTAARASFSGNIDGGVTSLGWAPKTLGDRYLEALHKDKSAMNVQLMLTYGKFVSSTAVKQACQVGFTDGFSALAILQSLPSHSTLVTFDAGDQNKTWAGTDFLQKAFPGRFQVVWGNTSDSIPMSAGNFSQPCDVAFVGTSHESPAPLDDLYNIMRLSRTNTTLVMFNPECVTAHNVTTCSDSEKAFQKGMREGWLVLEWYGPFGLSVGRFKPTWRWHKMAYVCVLLALGLGIGYLLVRLGERAPVLTESDREKVATARLRRLEQS